MAANKFATLLRRNTHKTAAILVYTLLEWTLIALLLLNALFSFLIAKFAAFFGLHPPCLLCSHLDRGSSYRDTLCAVHAAEVSISTYCSRHRRLAAATELCEDCSASRQSEAATAPLLSWMKRSESGEKDLRCSCCGVGLESGFLEILEPSWGVIEINQKGNSADEGFYCADLSAPEEEIRVQMVSEGVEDGGQRSDCAVHSAPEGEIEFQMVSEGAEDGDDLNLEREFEVQMVSEGVVDCGNLDPERELVVNMVDDSCVQGFANFFDGDEGRLVPVELIDSATVAAGNTVKPVIEDAAELVEPLIEFTDIDIPWAKRDAATMTDRDDDDAELWNDHAERDSAEPIVEDIEMRNSGIVEMVGIIEEHPAESVGSCSVENKFSNSGIVEMVGIIEEHPAESVGSCSVENKFSEAAEIPVIEEDGVDVEVVELAAARDSGELQGVASEPESKTVDADESNCEIFIGSEICDEEKIDLSHVQEPDSEQIGIEAEFLEDCIETTDKCEAVKTEMAVPIFVEATEVHVIEEDGVDVEVVESVVPVIEEDGVDVEVVESAVAGDSGEVEGVASELETKTIDADESNCAISIGSEICDEEKIDHSHVETQIGMECSEDCIERTDKCEASETEKADTIVKGVNLSSLSLELNDAEEEKTPETPSSVDGINATHQRFYFDRRETLNDAEEEKTPETPSSVDGINATHKRFYFDRRESSVESQDGSIASEVEGSEFMTADRLKAALNAERKALSALYAELEEERSASAIAANQTMAMITRLQQEKAEMQMEALQYQRMMEEQSEYDQEALQLLNELMSKREKEKHDLEKELEVYRHKVHLYEAKDRRKSTRRNGNAMSATSSPSSSAEDSDDISFDCHEEDDCFKSLKESNQNTPTDDVLGSRETPSESKYLYTLDASLADFEEERLSLLEHLKTLEEKLFMLNGEEGSNDRESMKHENGHTLSNGFSNDFGSNGKLHEDERSTGYRGRSLLPLFDAISMENGDEQCTEPHEMDDNKKLAITQEIDSVYERLRALDSDKMFLKHCISSLKKGDNGIHLLQEILLHLRDLRNAELQVRNASDGFGPLSD